MSPLLMEHGDPKAKANDKGLKMCFVGHGSTKIMDIQIKMEIHVNIQL